MLDHLMLAPKDEDEVEDFRDYNDESDLDSKLDEFEDEDAGDSSRGLTVAVAPPPLEIAAVRVVESADGEAPKVEPPSFERREPLVFISYSSDPDQQAAEDLTISLEKAGIQCWIASRDVGPGENYASAIINGIRSCEMVLLLLSASANRSAHVANEIERAVNYRKDIIPIRLEPVLPSKAIELHLSSRQWIDVFDAHRSAENMTRLTQALTERLKERLIRPIPAGDRGGSQTAAGAAIPSPWGARPAASLEVSVPKVDQLILRGASRMATALKATIGPMSRKVIINRKGGDPLLTNDSRLIVRELEFKDPIENVGAEMIRAVVNGIDRAARGGRATGAVLAYGLIREGMSRLAAGAQFVQMRRGMQNAVQVVAFTFEILSARLVYAEVKFTGENGPYCRPAASLRRRRMSCSFAPTGFWHRSQT